MSNEETEIIGEPIVNENDEDRIVSPPPKSRKRLIAVSPDEYNALRAQLETQNKKLDIAEMRLKGLRDDQYPSVPEIAEQALADMNAVEDQKGS